MKRLVSVLFVVAALCLMLVIPAAAAKPVEVNSIATWGECKSVTHRPVGKGDDEHYCLTTVDGCERGLVGEVDGTMILHYEIIKKGSCGSGPGTDPAVQRAWGTFTGEIWDGEEMRSGSCKATWHGGWDWVEEGTLSYGGQLNLHACTGGLAGAHANLEMPFVAGVEIYTGRAFFGGGP